jgi:hypothetical protein
MASQKGLGLNPKAQKLRYLDRTAEEAGRQKRWGDVPGRLTPKKVIARNVSIDDIEEDDLGQDFGIYYPAKFIKSFSERAQLDKLGAIYGLLKGFEGKTFDEYYSAFKTGCGGGNAGAMHVAQHAMEKLHTKIEIIDGVIYGSNNRRFGPTMFRLKKDDFYVDCEGIIRRITTDNVPKPKVYPIRKGFWADVKIPVYVDGSPVREDGVLKKEIKYKYVIGPFCRNHINRQELAAFELESQYSNNIFWKPGHKKVESQVPIEGHFQVKDWRKTYWSPKYYIVLNEAKMQQDPNSVFKNRKPRFASVGLVIYDEDFIFHDFHK